MKFSSNTLHVSWIFWIFICSCFVIQICMHVLNTVTVPVQEPLALGSCSLSPHTMWKEKEEFIKHCHFPLIQLAPGSREECEKQVSHRFHQTFSFCSFGSTDEFHISIKLNSVRLWSSSERPLHWITQYPVQNESECHSMRRCLEILLFFLHWKG